MSAFFILLSMDIHKRASTHSAWISTPRAQQSRCLPHGYPLPARNSQGPSCLPHRYPNTDTAYISFRMIRVYELFSFHIMAGLLTKKVLCQVLALLLNGCFILTSALTGYFNQNALIGSKLSYQANSNSTPFQLKMLGHPVGSKYLKIVGDSATWVKRVHDF
jgi:hypothetical protein